MNNNNKIILSNMNDKYVDNKIYSFTLDIFTINILRKNLSKINLSTV